MSNEDLIKRMLDPNLRDIPSFLLAYPTDKESPLLNPYCAPRSNPVISVFNDDPSF